MKEHCIFCQRSQVETGVLAVTANPDDRQAICIECARQAWIKLLAEHELHELNVVKRGSYKIESFFPMLATRLTGGPEWRWSAGEEVYYLGGGYWRASPVGTHGDEFDELTGPAYITGVKLINPDRTGEEIAIVTQAMNILIRG